MQKTLSKHVVVGPKDDGRHMSLDAFDRATGRDGYLYELKKGVIEATNVPHTSHFAQLQEVRNELPQEWWARRGD